MVLKNPRCKVRRGTIAFQFTEEPGVFKADIAFCSPKDHFSKKIGRFISEGRLKKGGNTFYLSEENPGVANAVLNNLDQFPYSPQCL